ncbi:PREDICTED: uncharacterized protein LOC109146688 [Ipomoea nil]|uniref:uncharacterized protein LOC109146688 n=1 Tax=Ipomoea nil TaxID=35883 RepID=UPI00090160D5|nr:PREDICTED: uncharacterized protein LOC109146688 [Ipomoea nil]
MASEAGDEISPAPIPGPDDGNRAGAFLKFFAHKALESEEVSRRRAEAQPLYLEAAQEEARHRRDILQKMSNNPETPIVISPDKSSVMIYDNIESVLPVEHTANINPVLSSENPTSVYIANVVSDSKIVEIESSDTMQESNKFDQLSLIVYTADVKSSVPLVETVSVEPQILSDEPAPAEIVVPRTSDSIDGIPVYTFATVRESLEQARYFAGLPSSSVPEPSKIIPKPEPSEQLDSDDERILTEVYGSKAPISVSDKPLTVEETAHPDSSTFRIRDVSNLLATSSTPLSESSLCVSLCPKDRSPVRETIKSKRKGVPGKISVNSGDDDAEEDQPMKKRRSADLTKAESDPPVQQVFKTLRSYVKSKVPATISTGVTRKVKGSIKTRGRSVLPVIQSAAESPDTSIYVPQFVSAAAKDKWSTMEVGLMKSITSECPYSKLLTYEFYCNLNEEIDNLSGKRCLQIFIRGKQFVFGPDVINDFYGLKAVDEEGLTDWDLIVNTLTGGQTPYWPTGDPDTLSCSQLAAILFRIGTKMCVDLGKWIFDHILTLIHPREKKVRLPYPNLIFGVLTAQGLVPMPSEIVLPSLLYTVDPRLLAGKHIKDVSPVLSTPNDDTNVAASSYDNDVQLSLRLKARVSELETVSNVITKQLNSARTDLAIVLLRLSLTDSAAAANVKSDSEDLQGA